MNKKEYDVVLVGGGIMSATLGMFLKQLEPSWSIALFEARNDVATESTNPWNNAGTGHAALCELNYMPEGADGSLSPAKAIEINQQFQESREWWATLVKENLLPNPEKFITSTPHMTFVEGESNVDYLRRRFEILKKQPLFADIEFSDDPKQIAEWAPLLVDRREKGEVFAATRSVSGTDVNFGRLTKKIIKQLTKMGMELHLETLVDKVRKHPNGTWDIFLKNQNGYGPFTCNAKFVFVGAGGGALRVLQSAKIPEIKGFGGFPISGKFLRCDNPKVVAQHKAKVYGKAKVGAPPMSVPHLDTRVVNGKESLLFGPFAGFTPKFLKKGTWLDLPCSIRLHNILPMLKIGVTQFALEKYLVKEVLASREKQLEALREYYPAADADDWEMIVAGQRVQVMKKDPEKGAILQFGTEVIASEDGTIAGLLGASPGASTAVHAMLTVLERCFPEKFEKKWLKEIKKAIPSYRVNLNDDAKLVESSMSETAKVLHLTH